MSTQVRYRMSPLDCAYQRACDEYNRWQSLKKRAENNPQERGLRLMAWQAKHEYEEALREFNQHMVKPR